MHVIKWLELKPALEMNTHFCVDCAACVMCSHIGKHKLALQHAELITVS